MASFKKILTVAALSGALAISVAGCSPASDPAPGSTADPTTVEIPLLPKDEAIAALVPQEIRDRGTLVFATDATAPPNQFMAEDGKTIIGNEVEFGNQIASIMGLKAEWVNVSFDTIIPGIQAGRYDTALTGMRDTKEREELVDFITYAKTGPQLFAKKENSTKISTPEELCGFSLGSLAGTIQDEQMHEFSDECVAAGKEPIDIKVFKTQAEQIQAVASGQVLFGVQNAVNNVYLAEQTEGAIVGFGKPFLEGPWGMPLLKDSELREPLYQATSILVGSPEYLQILEKWGNPDQAIPESKINDGN